MSKRYENSSWAYALEKTVVEEKNFDSIAGAQTAVGPPSTNDNGLYYSTAGVLAGIAGTVVANVTPPPNTCVQGTLHPINVGTAYNQRSGRQIILTEIEAMLSCYYLVGASPQNALLRICLILDKQADGSIPTLGQIWQDPLQGVNSMPNVSNAARFRFLEDKIVTFNCSYFQNATTGTMCERVHMHMRCNIPITFDDSAANNNNLGTIPFITTNNVFITCLASPSGVQNTSLFVDGTTRVKYIG